MVPQKACQKPKQYFIEKNRDLTPWSKMGKEQIFKKVSFIVVLV